MKKILFLLSVIACTTQLKAQQLTTKPGEQSLLKIPKSELLNQFQLKDSTLFRDFSIMPKGQLLAIAPNKLLFVNTGGNIDRMPILKMNGNIDRTPIAKVNGNMDKMPVMTIEPLSLPKPLIP